MKKNSAKGVSARATRSGPDVRKDRRSATGMSGSPKKGGHGGKFTWSGDGYSPAEIGWIANEDVDANDPNFEDAENKSPITGS